MKNNRILLGRKNRYLYYFIELIVVLFCCLFSSYKVSSIIALLLFLLYVVAVALEKPRIVFKYLYFYFMMVANVLGCFLCEFGDFFVIELSSNAHYVGALPVLVLSQLTFFTFIFEFELKNEKKVNKLLPQFKKESYLNEKTLFTLNIFVFVLYMALFVHILPYSALRLNVDRMTFANLGFNSGIWGSLSKWAQFFIPIPIACIAYTKKKKYRVFGVITLIIYCLYYLWIGNKFGSFFSLFCVFCMLMFSKYEIKEKYLKRILVIVICFMVVLIFGAAFIFTKFQTQGINVSSYIQNRLAQQGQLFWRTIDVSGGKLHFSEFGNEVRGTFARTNNAEDMIDAKYGVYNIMYLCAPKWKVDNFIRYGSRYTEAGYASAFYYFGLFGCMIFAIIIAYVVVKVTNLIVNSTKNSNLVGMILTIRMFYIICTVWQLFLFSDLFTGTSIITYFWLFATRHSKRIKLRTGTAGIGRLL